MPGYDGLALSLYDKNAISFTDDGAHNFFSITIADGTTVTSGYIQPFYASITASGSFSTGTQLNSFATDISLTGTIAGEVMGLAVYISGSGGTLTGGNISGVNIYLADVGAASMGARACLMMHIEDDGSATDTDAFIVARLEGTGGAVGAFLQFAGTASLAPTYFLVTNHAATSGGMYYGSYTASAVTGIGLRCLVAGAVYHIPLIAATSAA